MKRTIFAPALLLCTAPLHAAVGVSAPKPAAAPVLQTPAPKSATSTALAETCTRDGMRKGRYSQYSWCEWFSYFHQFKS